MTASEFTAWQDALATEYAREQVAAGRWAAEDADDRARAENARLLPAGVDTTRMLFLIALSDETVVGRAWVALDHPRGAPDCAFLYDIEIDEEHRGRGHGARLLAGAEDAVRSSGVSQLELNVFGGNARAISLYDGAGYAVVTQQMRKRLTG